jgi:hypothetical protein
MKSEREIALEKFRDYVISQAKANLTRMHKKPSGKLYNSIKGDVKEMPNSIRLGFSMEEYGFFQDKGVRGVGGVRATTSKFQRTNNKGKIWKQKGKGSPFSFKANNKPSVRHFREWANSKGLNPFAVREAVWRQGIAPSLFFTKPFEKAFSNLPDELIDAFGLDAVEVFNTIMNENFKKK